MDSLFKLSLFASIAFTGILCDASLDQSIKQLPARHYIGITLFSAYAKAADLKNCVIWYAVLGIGSALTSIVTAVLVWNKQASLSFPIFLAAFFAIAHSVCTSLAAPTYFKQKTITDEKVLKKLFNKFELISFIRSCFITLNFLSLLWALFNIV